MELKGILYKKLKKEKVEFPQVEIKRPEKVFEFPKIKDITKVNITYPLLEPFVFANIRWDEKERALIYRIIEPELSQKEKDMLKKINEGVIELIEVSLSAIKDTRKVVEYLGEQVKKVIEDLGLKLTPEQYRKFMYYIYRNFVGMSEIEPLLLDPFIEDISCDGVNVPLYIIHRKFGSLKTNLIFQDIDTLRELIIKMAEKCGRYVSYAEPILAGILPDGSRVSATLAPDVATRGGAFTIRKFTERPFSPIDQIELKTASSEVLAYFWQILQNKLSVLIAGGTATGKTSFLNSICMFIPREAKIISIEDTRELRLVHEHWVPGLARVGFGLPLPTGVKYGEVSLFDLLKESFRQNPDYVIVGEVRGAEAYVMFQGMSSGHPCMSTFHAGSIDAIIKRLTSPPINLAPTLVESLNVVAILVHAKEKGPTARRIKEVVEIVSVDPRTGEVSSNVVFRWNPVKDEIEKVGDSVMLRRIAAAIGARIEDVEKEVERKKLLLDWLKENNIKDYREVCEWIHRYYKNPEEVMMEIRRMPKVKPTPPEKPKEKVSFWDLLRLIKGAG